MSHIFGRTVESYMRDYRTVVLSSREDEIVKNGKLNKDRPVIPHI